MSWACLLQEEKHRAELLLEQRKIEKELETERYVAYRIQLKGFIRTKAEPRLFYLPAK